MEKPISNKSADLGTTLGAKARGAQAEELACQWLVEQGLVLQDRNFRTRHGEIDLIMQSGDCLIFVEVRYRKTIKFGSAEEGIHNLYKMSETDSDGSGLSVG